MEMISVEDKKRLFSEIVDEINEVEDFEENQVYEPVYLKDWASEINLATYDITEDGFWVRFNYPDPFRELHSILLNLSNNNIYKDLKNQGVKYYVIEKLSLGPNDNRGVLGVIKNDTALTLSRNVLPLTQSNFNKLEKAGLSFINERDTHDKIVIGFSNLGTKVIIYNYSLIGDKNRQELFKAREKLKRIIEKSLDEAISSAWSEGLAVHRHPEENYYFFGNYSRENFAEIYDQNKHSFDKLGLKRVAIFPYKPIYDVECNVKDNEKTKGFDVEFKIRKLKNLDVVWGDVNRVNEKGRVLLYRYPEGKLYYGTGFNSPFSTYQLVNYGFLANEVFEFIEDQFFREFFLQFIKNADVDMNRY